MQIKEEYLHKSAAEAWDTVVDYVKAHGSFRSITGIEYTATFVGSCIYIKGLVAGTKRGDKGEYLTGKDFMYAYDIAKTLEKFNTSTIKPYIKHQQSLFVGLLVCAGIVEL